MNNTRLNCSLNDTSNLKKLIIENPELPLLIFAGEEAWCDEFPYTQTDASNGEIKKLTLYNDYWVDKEDYTDRLSDRLCDEEEYKNLTDEEYEKMIKEKVKNTEFVKAIVIYVG